MIDDEEEEWDQELVYKENEDLYELPLAAAHYMMVIKYPGLEQLSEHVVISPLEDSNTVLFY
jgi:hypothetical protein